MVTEPEEIKRNLLWALLVEANRQKPNARVFQQIGEQLIELPIVEVLYNRNGMELIVGEAQDDRSG